MLQPGSETWSTPHHLMAGTRLVAPPHSKEHREDNTPKGQRTLSPQTHTHSHPVLAPDIPPADLLPFPSLVGGATLPPLICHFTPG